MIVPACLASRRMPFTAYIAKYVGGKGESTLGSMTMAENSGAQRRANLAQHEPYRLKIATEMKQPLQLGRSARIQGNPIQYSDDWAQYSISVSFVPSFNPIGGNISLLMAKSTSFGRVGSAYTRQDSKP